MITKEIFENAKQDKESFRLIYESYFDRVYKYIFWRLYNREDSEDVTTLAFMKLLNSLSSITFRTSEEFSAYIFTICRSCINDFLRSKRRVGSSSLTEEIIDQQSIDLEGSESRLLESEITNENILEIKKLINRLPKSQRELVRLRYFAELTNREIALLKNLEEKSVSSALSKALKKLRIAYFKQV